MFHDDIDYVIRNMHSDWQYMPLMHTEKGEMYIWEKNYAGALTEAQKALSQNPKFAKAHALSVTAYKGMNQTDKALAAATEGLKHNPESRSLKRLYVETGGKPPYPEPYEKPQEPETVSAEPPPTETKSAVESTTEGTQLTPTTPANPVVPESIQKANPYCRFCPE